MMVASLNLLQTVSVTETRGGTVHQAGLNRSFVSHNRSWEPAESDLSLQITWSPPFDRVWMEVHCLGVAVVEKGARSNAAQRHARTELTT